MSWRISWRNCNRAMIIKGRSKSFSVRCLVWTIVRAFYDNLFRVEINRQYRCRRCHVCEWVCGTEWNASDYLIWTIEQKKKKRRTNGVLKIYFLVLVPHTRHWLNGLFIEQGDNARDDEREKENFNRRKRRSDTRSFPPAVKPSRFSLFSFVTSSWYSTKTEEGQPNSTCISQRNKTRPWSLKLPPISIIGHFSSFSSHTHTHIRLE